MSQLSPELYWLTLTALATALFWLPYTLELIRQMGLNGALADGQHETRLEASWARRAKRAHTNAVENLIVFAALVIALQLSGQTTPLTATVCMVFFASRMGHYAVYVAGLPYIRTVLFAISWTCQLILAASLLGFV
ncbi:MAG: MAPEG family protein [Pseudomonadota bacterium]